MTADQAADILIRLESGWNERWSATKVDLWLEQLQALDFTDTYDAVTELFRTNERPPTFAVVRAHVDMIRNRRQPIRPGRLCLRCRKEPAEQGRIRCTACQAIVDDETQRGIHSPAMTAAITAAHKRSHA